MPMLAGVGLLMVCCSSSSAAAMMMGREEKEDPVVPKTPAKKSPEQIKADEAKAALAIVKADPNADAADILDAQNEADNAQAEADAADDSDDDDVDPSCSLQNGDNVQYGCGHVYQDTINAQAQCGATEPLTFIWDGTGKSACGINRGDIVQKCSKYIYQKESDANAQCVAFGGTNTPVPFIPTE